MKIDMSRRCLLQNAAFLFAITTLYPAMSALAKGGSLSLAAAGYRFPRTQSLFDGTVLVDGCNVNFEEVGIGDINTNMLSGPQTWDFAEVGLHPFMLAYANDGFRDCSLLPIFPLRLFRHKSIFIRTDRGINKPQDLKGKTVATPGYSSTSLTWIRGILQDEYGVKPEDINWIYALKDSSKAVSGKASAQENVFPDGITINPGPEGLDESELLASGAVDALFHAAIPKVFLEGHSKVGRLFIDSKAAEQDYYRKTGIFPIMHVVAVRKRLLEKHPWLAKSLFMAYSMAKSVAYQKMTGVGWGADMLPWYGQELEATQQIMGRNFYSYGIKGNELALNTIFRYSYEQGLSSRQLTIEELFNHLMFQE